MKPETITQRLLACSLPPWDVLPDFGLYMDQLITYTDRIYSPLGAHSQLTPAMINNYVKAGLIDRPKGKQYSRESLAQVLIIYQLKHTTSLEMLKELLHEEGADTRIMYEKYRVGWEKMSGHVERIAQQVPLTCAMASAICMQICAMLPNPEPEPEENTAG